MNITNSCRYNNIIPYGRKKDALPQTQRKAAFFPQTFSSGQCSPIQQTDTFVNAGHRTVGVDNTRLAHTSGCLNAIWPPCRPVAHTPLTGHHSGRSEGLQRRDGLNGARRRSAAGNRQATWRAGCCPAPRPTRRQGMARWKVATRLLDPLLPACLPAHPPALGKNSPGQGSKRGPSALANHACTCAFPTRSDIRQRRREPTCQASSSADTAFQSAFMKCAHRTTAAFLGGPPSHPRSRLNQFAVLPGYPHPPILTRRVDQNPACRQCGPMASVTLSRQSDAPAADLNALVEDRLTRRKTIRTGRARPAEGGTAEQGPVACRPPGRRRWAGRVLPAYDAPECRSKPIVAR